jgi:tetratricopeptide (TPR) repeat protein
MESLGSLFLTRTDGDPSRDLPEAKQWFQGALRITRGPRVLTFLGSTYAALKDYGAAKNVLDEPLQIDPTYEEAYFNLALLEKGRNDEEAQRLLTKAIDIDPDYAKAHQQLCRTGISLSDRPTTHEPSWIGSVC